VGRGFALGRVGVVTGSSADVAWEWDLSTGPSTASACSESGRFPRVVPAVR